MKSHIVHTSSEQTPKCIFCFSSCISLFEHLRLGISLQACLLQIVGYRNLIADVEKLRREPYDSDNPQHEEMLLKVSP